MSTTMLLYTFDAGVFRHWQSTFPDLSFFSADYSWPEQSDVILILDVQSTPLPSWNDPIWQARCAQSKVIVVNSNPVEQEGYEALRAGAVAYCHALAPKILLQQVLSVVQAGDIWVGRTLVQRLLSAVERLPSLLNQVDFSSLSEREQQVADCVARGLANKEIARQLDVTERTIKAHLTTIFEKMAVRDRVQLALRMNGIT